MGGDEVICNTIKWKRAVESGEMGLYSPVETIQTRKTKFGSIQFCIGHLVLFTFVCFQLSCFYGLSLLVLSIRYHVCVITQKFL